jgi:creatinine amidohydrolase
MSMEFESLTRAELEALPRDRTLFIFSVGPIEDHGPYLPIGMDMALASEFSKKLIDRLKVLDPTLNCLLMPRLPLGLDSNTSEFALTVRPYVLRDYLVDTCRGLSRRGFKWFAVISGHLGPKQLTAIEEAGKLLNRGWPMSRGLNKRWLLSLSSLWVSHAEIKKSALWNDPSEHGGPEDAALATLFSLKGANLPALSKSPALPDSRGGYWNRWYSKLTGQTSGTWGDPSKSDPLATKATIERRIDRACEYLKSALAAESHGKTVKRPQSAFHWIPTNRTFFKAWFLFLLILMIMMVWVYIFYDFLDL